MSSTTDIASSFIAGAPPGELNDVVNGIKALTSDSDPSLITKIKPAFQKYNEDQLTCVKLPGAAQPVRTVFRSSSYFHIANGTKVLISKYNRLSPTSYYDTSSSTSFDYDHTSQKASNSQSYTHDSSNTTLISSTLKALATHFSEHYPSTSSSAFTVCQHPDNDSEIVILLSTTKSSPSNFLSGRWRSTFTYDAGKNTLAGTISIQVHYYEDGNVALNTSKTVSEISDVSATGAEIVKRVAAVEKQYQEGINRALVGMNEGAFKSLRRQLPVTRQKVEWERVRGYSLGGDLKGEGKRRL